jgi:hypothetical protein
MIASSTIVPIHADFHGDKRRTTCYVYNASLRLYLCIYIKLRNNDGNYINNYIFKVLFPNMDKRILNLQPQGYKSPKKCFVKLFLVYFQLHSYHQHGLATILVLFVVLKRHYTADHQVRNGAV